MVILCLSCQKNINTRIQWIRNTWGKDLDIHYVIGDSNITKSKKNSNGLLRIPIDTRNPFYSDFYLGGSWKIYQGLCYIYTQYCPDYCFVCDDDTYCIWERLSSAMSVDTNWVGRSNTYFDIDTVFGGSGFILSKQAIEAVVEPSFECVSEFGDIWISRLLNKAKIKLTNHDGFLPYENFFDGNWDNILTCHPVRTEKAFYRIYECTTIKK